MIALALVLLATLAVPSLLRDPGERVRALSERYREHLLERRPDLAVRWRVRGARHELAVIDEATLDRDAATVAVLIAETQAIAAAGLDPVSASLKRMLEARLQEEQAQVAAGGTLRYEPMAWVRLLRGTLEGVVASPRRSPCQRAATMTPILSAAPELLRAASIVVREPWADPALRDSLEVTQRWLREALPAIALDCRDPLRLGAFVQADTLALQALGRFGAYFLADTTFDDPAPGDRRSPRGAAGR